MPIVQAIGTSVHSDIPGLGEFLEAALTAAVSKALADGVPVHDSSTILQIKEEALQKALDEWHRQDIPTN